MATARLGRNDRGELYIFASVMIDGERIRRKMRVPNDDEEVGQEAVRQLQVKLSMGNLSFFEAPSGSHLKARPSQPAQGETFQEWAPRWLASVEPPEIEESTHRTYRTHVKHLVAAIGACPLSEIREGVVKRVRQEMQREGRAIRTIDSRLGVLRLMMIDARGEGLIEKTPFDTPIRRPRTKRRRAAAKSKRVTFQPLIADELEALLKVLRNPRDSTERMFHPLTEALLLTGLRWAEPAAWVWPDVSTTGSQVHICRALPKHGTLELAEIQKAPPTKTGEVWSIPLRKPLAESLMRQRQRSYVGRPRGWVFPNSVGGHVHYRNWLARGWRPTLQRAHVAPRAGDAQKALRRTYITSALICGRNAKEVSAEVGHTTPRMVNDVYDSFIDPASWPTQEERERLTAIFGWGIPRSPSVKHLISGTHWAPNST